MTFPNFVFVDLKEAFDIVIEKLVSWVYKSKHGNMEMSQRTESEE